MGTLPSVRPSEVLYSRADRRCSTVAGKGYHAIRMDIAELNMKLNRGASPASRATRQRFRDKLEDDLRSVTSDGQIVSVAGRTDVSFGIRNYFDRLEIATIPAAPPPIDALWVYISHLSPYHSC